MNKKEHGLKGQQNGLALEQSYDELKKACEGQIGRDRRDEALLKIHMERHAHSGDKGRSPEMRWRVQ